MMIESDFKWPLGASWTDHWLVVECEGRFDPNDDSIEDLKMSFGLPLGDKEFVLDAMEKLKAEYSRIEDCAVSSLCEKAREDRRAS